MNEKTRKLTLMAMLCALAFIVMLVARIPVVPTMPFLKYDPKDVVVVIGGFLLGPLPAAAISLVVSLIEMVTVSDSGFIGLFMNVLSTCAFALPAAWLYRRDRTLRGAALGLVAGVAFMTVAMVAWNYIVTPLYQGVPREAIAALLVPVFLPFNAGKGAINAGIAMLIYKPAAQALRRARLMPATSSPERRFSLTATVLSVFVVVTAILCFKFLPWS